MTEPGSTILLVEDDEHDAFFFQRALKKARPDLRLQIVTDGEQALAYFFGHLKYSNRVAYPVASTVFLDLKLPYLNGFEILERIRSVPALVAIPVVILTSSSEDRDRRRAAELEAKGYLVKPPVPEMLVEILGRFPNAKVETRS